MAAVLKTGINDVQAETRGVAEQDRKPSTTTALFPDERVVLEVCRVATAEQESPGLITETSASTTTADGIRVRFTTSVHQELAQSHLRALGYAVRPDSRPISEEHGEALLVTGWCEADLSSRAGYAERAVRDLVGRAESVADDALKAYRGYVELGYSHQDAWDATTQEVVGPAVKLGGSGARRSGVHAWASAAIHERDLRRADDETYRVLCRVQVAERAHRLVTGTYEWTVAKSVELFVRYVERDGADQETAATRASGKASDGAAAFLERARADVDGRDN